MDILKQLKEKPWHKGNCASSSEEFLDSLKMARVLLDRETEIEGWGFDYEPMAGAWYWHNDMYPSIHIIATLFWEGEPSLFFDINNDDGSEILASNEIPFLPSDDLEKDLARYVREFKGCLATKEAKEVLSQNTSK